MYYHMSLSDCDLAASYLSSGKQYLPISILLCRMNRLVELTSR